MDYNPKSQYRCTIIRGKSISRMDDYLPIYANILNEICPIRADKFNETFDKKLSKYIKDDEKTIKNHRTENVQKLLGMCYEKEEIIYVSRRTIKYIDDGDQPAFFKGVCFNFQQPNGSQKVQTLKEKVHHEVNIKPYHYILALLKLASDNSTILTKNEIAYYVLNALEVLQGNITIGQVFDKILSDRKKGEMNEVKWEGKASSYNMQHINEQIDYLLLANLIRKDKTNIKLNDREIITINLFNKELNTPLQFSIAKYDLSKEGINKEIELDWQEYFGNIADDDYKSFKTTIDSLEEKITEVAERKLSTVEIGDAGEEFVLKIEKEEVHHFNPRLVNKVNHHGKTKGLGYDVTSIEAGRNKKTPEFLRYIEVKATIRVTPPNLSDTLDSITLTRSEWVAAEQHLSHFYIYRVYFTSECTFLNIINNPFQKNNDGLIYTTPTLYRLEFGDKGIDEKHEYA